MELDDDADDGGCFDGVEDTNGNGKFEQGRGEGENFKKDDDACVSGTYEWVHDLVQNGELTGVTKNYSRHAARISLLPQADGTLKGRAELSFLMTQSQRMPTGCFASDVQGDPMTWSVEFEGEARRQADGSVKITMRPTSESQPTYRYPWRNTCANASGVATTPVPVWPWTEATLKDGVFDFESSPPLGPGAFGAPGRGGGMKMHMEQRRPPTPP